MWHFVAFTLVIAYLMFYCIIPNMWLRNYSKSVLRYGKDDVLKVYLTFDDGPNPECTVPILSILKEYGVTATFFVVGKNALLYPEIIENIKDDGHIIGIHSYTHLHAWLMFPFAVFKDLAKSCAIIKKLTGKNPKWYRPPWGTFNLLIPFAVKKYKLSTAFWSVSAHDWKTGISHEYIANTVLNKIRPGSIIVLHDNSGNFFAPKMTAEALPIIIRSLKNQGYHFATLNELGGEIYAKESD